MDPLVAGDRPKDKPLIPFGFVDHSLKFNPYPENVIVDPENLVQKEAEKLSIAADPIVDKLLSSDDSSMSNDDAVTDIVDYTDEEKSLIMLGLTKADDSLVSSLLLEETSTVDMDGDLCSYMSSLESTLDDLGLSIPISNKLSSSERADIDSLNSFIDSVLSDTLHSVEHWKAFDRFHSNRLRSSSIMDAYEKQQKTTSDNISSSESQDVEMVTERVVKLGESLGHDPSKLRSTIRLILDQSDSGLADIDIQSQHNIENHLADKDSSSMALSDELASRLEAASSYQDHQQSSI